MIHDIVLFGGCILLVGSVYLLGYRNGELAALRWVDKTIDEVFEEVLEDIQKQVQNETGNNSKD